MGWYTLDKKYGEAMQLNYAVSELFDGITVLESHRQVYTANEKQKYSIDYDAVSHHAVKDNATNRIKAIIMLERIDDKHITYKPFTENDCPGEAACPRSILEKLSPTENDYALEWRIKAYSLLQYPGDESKMVDLTVTTINLPRIDPDANPLYSKDGNEFTDSIIEHFESQKPTLPFVSKKNNEQTLTANAMEKTNEVSFKGQIGKNPIYKSFESGKSTLAFTIKPEGKNTNWQKVRAANDQADNLYKAMTNPDNKLTKIEVTGDLWKDTSYPDKTTGEQIKEKELQVKVATKFLNEVHTGKITSIAEKQSKATGRPFTEIKLDRGEKGEISLTLYESSKKNIPPDLKLEPGATITAKVEVGILVDREGNDLRQKYYQVWNIDKNAKRLDEQINKLIEQKREREKEKGTKKTSSKGKEQSM